MQEALIFWGVVVVVTAVVEAATVGLVSIWFTGGALAALLAAALGAPLWLQAVLFLAVSAALLAAIRPIARKYITPRQVATNADRNIGKTAEVIEPIDNLHGTGRVMIGSVDWTARSVDGTVIEKGALVRVLRIEGVKVCVERAAQGAVQSGKRG